MSVTTGTSLTKSEPAPKTMRAAILTAPNKIELQESSVPEVAPDEVLIRLEGSGVCASNLEVWAGQPWFNYPLETGAPGHEGWGKIAAIGGEVKNFQIGDRVAFLSGHAYAEYDRAKADQCVKLPAALDGKPFPGEPLGCAMNIFARSDIQAGQTVAIVGIGFLGAILCRLAEQVGARVIAVSRREYSLEVAKQFGAHETIQLNDNQTVIETIKKLTEEKLCERVIEAVGKQSPLDLAAELCAERAKLIVAGYHQDGARQVNMWLWNWRGLDVINAHERDPKIYLQGMQAAVEAVTNNVFDPTALYTHQFNLENLGDALDAARDRPDGFLKALITL